MLFLATPATSLVLLLMSLRQSMIQHGAKVYGSMIMSNSANVAELLSSAGYDFLLFDHEHSPAGIGSCQALMQASSCRSSTEQIVRLPSNNDAVYMKKVLDSMKLPGGVLVPMIETAEQAVKVVQSTRYPPLGNRGCAVPLIRATGWGIAKQDDYLKQCQNDLLVAVQVESQAGVENIPEIAAVDGIDLIFLGPIDLSASIGKMSNFDDPDVQALQQRAEQFVRDSECCLLGGFRAPGRSLEEMFGPAGYSLVAGSADMGLLRQGALADVQDAVDARKNG